jgi:hypothetical protein
MGMDNTALRGVHRTRGGIAWDRVHQYTVTAGRRESQGREGDSTQQEIGQRINYIKKII